MLQRDLIEITPTQVKLSAITYGTQVSELPVSEMRSVEMVDSKKKSSLDAPHIKLSTDVLQIELGHGLPDDDLQWLHDYFKKQCMLIGDKG